MAQAQEEFAASGRAPAPAGRPLAQRSQGLSQLTSGADQPYVPAGRLSAPPPNPPPVFERPAEPRPDVRPWHVPKQTDAPATEAAPAWYEAAPAAPAPAAAPATSAPAAPSAPARPVPAFTAHGDAGRPAAPPASVDVALGRPARGRRGRGVVAGLFALLLAGGAAYAAVSAVPRYLQKTDRDVWERTSVRIPRTLAGLPRITTASATTQARDVQTHLLGSGTGQMISDLAVYGRSRGTRVAVVVARPQHPLEADERELVRSGFVSAMEASGVVLTERDAGDLGGWFGCGVKAGRTTTCLAVDAGAVVSVTVTTTGASAVTVAREARTAVERRTP